MDRVVQIEQFSAEIPHENSLRPLDFDGYIGQEKIKENLKIFIQSAKLRGAALDHCLFFGPAGLGKTTLANIIAAQMGVGIKTTAAPMIEKSGDLAAILTNLEEGDVLFIDEIHRLSPAIEEVLYPAMEDFRLDIIIGSGPAAQTVKIDLAKFTLIAATTKSGGISTPLRDRFGIAFKLEFYSPEELAAIISRAAKKLNIHITPDAALLLASRSRATPRIALRLLRRVRDFALVASEPTITAERAQTALAALGVSDVGLDESDLAYLRFLCSAQKAVGLVTLAAALSEDERTIEDVIEPYLLANGYIEKTPKGRLATAKSYAALNLSPAPIGGLFS